MTKRVIRAMENQYVTMLAHPTGRLLLKREPYEIDIPAIIEAAAATGTWIEINAAPKRLDLDWRWWPLAKQKGVKCVINPDAHRTERLQDLWFGVGVARKGWLTKEDVMNCLPLRKNWRDSSEAQYPLIDGIFGERTFKSRLKHPASAGRTLESHRRDSQVFPSLELKPVTNLIWSFNTLIYKNTCSENWYHGAKVFRRAVFVIESHPQIFGPEQNPAYAGPTSFAPHFRVKKEQSFLSSAGRAVRLKQTDFSGSDWDDRMVGCSL